jgi:hypothetical protein
VFVEVCRFECFVGSIKCILHAEKGAAGPLGE